jgi:hypothetical protein
MVSLGESDALRKELGREFEQLLIDAGVQQAKLATAQKGFYALVDEWLASGRSLEEFDLGSSGVDALMDEAI